MAMISTDRPLTEAEVNALSMLALAHVGDGVYELLVREMLCRKGPSPMQELHRKTVSYVRAEAQAKAARRLQPVLDEEETAVFRRGRNCHVHGIPAHANPGEYHSATGLEALFGWLYLRGRTERIQELFALAANEESEQLSNGIGCKDHTDAEGGVFRKTDRRANRKDTTAGK